MITTDILIEQSLVLITVPSKLFISRVPGYCQLKNEWSASNESLFNLTGSTSQLNVLLEGVWMTCIHLLIHPPTHIQPPIHIHPLIHPLIPSSTYSSIYPSTFIHLILARAYFGPCRGIRIKQMWPCPLLETLSEHPLNTDA